jgi:hypothetical protein
VAPGEPDPLAAFVPEDPAGAGGTHHAGPGTPGVRAAHDLTRDAAPRTRAAAPRPQGTSLRTAFLVIGAVLALVAGGIVAFQLQGGSLSAPTPVVRTGRLMLETRPPGAQVEVDGQPRGATPLALDLTVGEHAVRLRHETEERTLSVNMTAGAQMTQYLELAATSVSGTPVGHLTVVTEPPGARVSIDGEARGVSPVTIRDLQATRHRVTVAGATGSAERAVDIEPGGTTSVVFSLGRPGVTAGWLSVQAAFDVQIAQGVDIVGSSAAPRVMMAAGRHEITFSNAELGFEDRRQVEIRPGATTTVRLDAVAALNINARPWADVAVDGVSLGQTPIANHSLPLGSHVVVFRHPDLGERRQTVVVTARGPNRISMDLTR